ncbi:hypothetical protein MBLNU13_g00386t1 [Cladosporium sp. NU13]
MSSKTSNNGADESRQNETKIEPNAGDDLTANQPRNDTPLQTPTPHKTSSDRAILTLLLVSGQITQAEYMAYKYIHSKNKTRHTNPFAATANTTVKFSRLPPDAVWRVLNTPELLEMILLRLGPAHVLTSVQLTCRGFKPSVENSPEFQCSIATATRDGFPHQLFAWNIAPRCMHYHYTVSGRLVFSLTFSTLPFDQYLFMKGFRRLPVSDMLPQRIEVLWYYGKWSEGSWHTLGGSMVWLGSRGGNRLTFGQIFDAVARNVPDGRQLGVISLFVTAGREIHRGPSFVDGAEALNLSTRSA